MESCLGALVEALRLLLEEYWDNSREKTEQELLRLCSDEPFEGCHSDQRSDRRIEREASCGKLQSQEKV